MTELKIIRNKTLSQVVVDSVKIKRPKVEDVIFFIHHSDKDVTQEDFWMMWIDYHGYIHFGSINPLFNKAERKGIIRKTGNNKLTVFGKPANTYEVVA